MKLNIFKRQKVENSTDLSEMMVELPKSKKEVSLVKCIEEYDKLVNMHGYASEDHMVKVGNEEMSVKDLVKAHQAKCNEIEELKKNGSKEQEMENDDAIEHDDEMENDATEDGSIDQGEHDLGEHGGDHSLENEVDEEEDHEDKKKNKKHKNSDEMTVEEAKRIIANNRAKAARVKNAPYRVGRDQEADVKINLPQDMVARGKSRYGSLI
jgi:cobalamin biosynthesis protein CobT